MRTIIAVVLVVAMLLGVTGYLNAQPVESTANEPEIIVTVDGNPVDVPTAIEDDRIVVEIPETRKWRVLRGDYKRSRRDGMVVLSFSIPVGYEPTVARDRERGRLLIHFARIEEPVTPRASSTMPVTPAPPPISPPIAARTPPVEPSKALKQRLGAVNLDLAVPESPAFAVLGITPQNVIRPTSPRAFAASLLNGMDEKGNFQTGLAMDTAPYLLLAGPELTLEDYQQSPRDRFLSRTNLSLGTTKGATDDDPSIKLGLGLHFTLKDAGDPRLDQELLADINKILTEISPFDPREIKRAQELKQQGKTDAEIFADRIARIHAELEPFRENARKRHWNATSWVIGLAPSWISKSGNTDDFQWNGGGIWTSYAYGFERIKGLENNSQLVLHLRFRDDQLVPDPEKEGSFLREDSILMASQFRIGRPDLNFFLSPAYIYANASGRSGDAFRGSVGIEMKITTDLWLNLSVGHDFGDTIVSDRTFALGSVRLGASSRPRLVVPQP